MKQKYWVFLSSVKKLTTSKENRTPTRQFVESDMSHILAESGGDAEDQLQSQLLYRKLSSSEVDRKTNALVAPLSTQLKTLIQSVRELSERSSNRWTEKNVASKESGSSCQRSNIPTVKFPIAGTKETVGGCSGKSSDFGNFEQHYLEVRQFRYICCSMHISKWIFIFEKYALHEKKCELTPWLKSSKRASASESFQISKALVTNCTCRFFSISGTRNQNNKHQSVAFLQMEWRMIPRRKISGH